MKKNIDKSQISILEMKEFITGSMDIKIIINEYSEQLCAHKFNNLDELDQFFQIHILPKFTKE